MKFDNEFHNQIKGTIFAATYAILLMGYVEIKFYSVCTFKYGERLAEYMKENRGRFLDDWYADLRCSQISSEELLLTLNSINPSIQCTMEYSKDQIPFLDILMKRNENGIWMDLYHKPTDTQRCLPFTSIHLNQFARSTESTYELQNFKIIRLILTFHIYIYIYIYNIYIYTDTQYIYIYIYIYT